MGDKTPPYIEKKIFSVLSVSLIPKLASSYSGMRDFLELDKIVKVLDLRLRNRNHLFVDLEWKHGERTQDLEMRNCRVCLLILLFMIPGFSAGKAFARDAKQPVVTNIKLTSGASIDRLRLSLKGGLPDTNLFKLTGPDRIAVDLTGCILGSSVNLPKQGATRIAEGFRFGRYPDKVRVVADVDSLKDVDASVATEGNAVVIAVAKRGRADSERAGEAVEKNIDAHDTEQPVVTNIGLTSKESADRLRLHFEGKRPGTRLFKLTSPDRIVIDLTGCKMSPRVRFPRQGARIAKGFRFGRYPDKVRVVADVDSLKDVDASVETEGNSVVITIARRKTGEPSKTEATQVEGKQQPVSGESRGKEAVESSRKAATIEKNEENARNEAPSLKNQEDEGTIWNQAGWGEPERDSGDHLKFSGGISLRGAVDIHDQNQFEDDGYGHGKMILKAEYKPDKRIQFVASTAVDYFLYANDHNYRDDDTFRFDETYINFANPHYNIKIGNQIVRWGKTDGYSPLDNLNPEDYRDGIAGRREDRKLPIPMANIELYHGTMTLQGIFIPFFVEPKFDLTGTNWAMFRHANQEISGFRVHEDYPAKKLSNSEFGVRFSGIIQNLDYAVSWFHTREYLPVPDSLTLPPGFVLPPGEFSPTDLAMFAASTGQTVDLVHPRKNIFGLSMETTWRVFGIRADVAYSDHNSLLSSDLHLVRKPALKYVVGFDYNSPNAWYFNLQYFQNRFFDYDESMVWSHETTNALTGLFRKDFFDGDFEMECRAYYDLSGDGTMVNPKFIINRWSPLKFELGAEFFGGTVDTPFGYYGDNDDVYILASYKF